MSVISTTMNSLDRLSLQRGRLQGLLSYVDMQREKRQSVEPHVHGEKEGSQAYFSLTFCMHSPERRVLAELWKDVWGSRQSQ